MLLECEMADSGIYCGHPQELPPEEWDRLGRIAGDWRLLFQMGTVERDGFELMFGDCGWYLFLYPRGGSGPEEILTASGWSCNAAEKKPGAPTADGAPGLTVL